jgi:hypothetical protein
MFQPMESRSFEVASVEEVFSFMIFGISHIIPHIVYSVRLLRSLFSSRNMRGTLAVERRLEPPILAESEF